MELGIFGTEYELAQLQILGETVCVCEVQNDRSGWGMTMEATFAMYTNVSNSIMSVIKMCNPI